MCPRGWAGTADHKGHPMEAACITLLLLSSSSQRDIQLWFERKAWFSQHWVVHPIILPLTHPSSDLSGRLNQTNVQNKLLKMYLTCKPRPSTTSSDTPYNRIKTMRLLSCPPEMPPPHFSSHWKEREHTMEDSEQNFSKSKEVHLHLAHWPGPYTWYWACTGELLWEEKQEAKQGRCKGQNLESINSRMGTFPNELEEPVSTL